MDGRLFLLLLLAGPLAGCGAPQVATSSSSSDEIGNRMVIAGLVQSEGLLPLQGAHLQLAGTNVSVLSGDDGTFRFPPVEPRVYSVVVKLTGYLEQSVVAQPGTNENSLEFVLVKDTPPEPRQSGEHARGILECAHQAVVLGGSCDETVQPVSGPLLQNISRFPFLIGSNWRTIVIDLVFDGKASPLLDGLSIHVDGFDYVAQRELVVGDFGDSSSFTVRLEPHQSYPGSTGPVNGNVTWMQIDVRPRGLAQDEACTVGQLAGRCFSGVGVGDDVQFDLYVTSFYVKEAPAGFTLRPN